MEVKTLFTEAIQKVFSSTYPVAKFADTYVSMEFPENQVNYPGIWVDFTPTSMLQSAGIGHTIYTQVGLTTQTRKATEWRFGGQVSFTVAAMTSLERDSLVDEVVRVVAFGNEDPDTAVFRSMIEINDLIQISMQWDTFALTGKAETPGTPWGTDELIYEMTIQMECQGLFISDADTGVILSELSQIQTTITGPDDAPAVLAPSPTGPVAGADPRNVQWH